jgi:hypothetical protein
VTKRRKSLAFVLALLYIVTAVGGWRAHARRLQDDTEAQYRRIERQNQEWSRLAQEIGDTRFYPIELNARPTSKVHWCVPILPGVLLAHSEYHIGPMLAAGGFKIVLYYGFGATEVFMFGWIT